MAAQIHAGELRARGERRGERPQTLSPRRRRIDVAPQVGDDLDRAPGIDQRVRGLVRDVITECPCGDRGVRRATDRMQQAEIEGILELIALKTHTLGQLDRQQAGAQAVLRGLPRPEIARQRQRREQLA
jgi:hypothetical protein